MIMSRPMGATAKMQLNYFSHVTKIINSAADSFD